MNRQDHTPVARETAFAAMIEASFHARSTAPRMDAAGQMDECIDQLAISAREFLKQITSPPKSSDRIHQSERKADV